MLVLGIIIGVIIGMIISFIYGCCIAYEDPGFLIRLFRSIKILKKEPEYERIEQ